jgi:CspA family cold shock protein
MTIGIVKVVTDKGYGFIQVEGAEKDTFYHQSVLTGDLATRGLRVGDKVSFDIEQGPKGPNAVNIQLVTE